MATINVDASASDDKSQPYQKIQTAIKNADSDDTIDVAPGTYDESVTIDIGELTLKGPNAGTLGDSDQRGDEATITEGVDVKASTVTLDGLEVRNPGKQGAADPEDFAGAVGVNIQTTETNVTVKNTVLTDIGTNDDDANPIGIFAPDGTTGLTVSNNLITDLEGTDEDQGAVQAVLVDESGTAINDVSVTDNTITDLLDTRSTVAVRFNGDVSGSISGNEISGLNTEGTIPGSGGAPGGFTQVIALQRGGASETGPSSVTIEDNNISNIETTTDDNFAPPFHIIIGPDADADTITIENNNFSADSPDTDVYISGSDLTLDAILNNQGNTFDLNASVVGDTTIVPTPGEGEAVTETGEVFDGDNAIQNAIAEADAGVLVGPGMFNESVTIGTEGLTVESAVSATLTVVGQSSNAVIINANDVTVSGLDIENPTGSGDGNTSVNAVGVKVDPANTGVIIKNNSIGPVGTEVNTNVIGVYIERDANDVTVRNNTLSELDGTDDDKDRTQAILLIAQEGGNVGKITGATISDNTINNVTDTRSVKAIEFNGNISGSITGNDIKDLGTDGPAGTGFTQAIALGQGSNANTGPSDVLIENNTVSNLEAGTPADFAPPSHIILSAVDDVSTIDITNNEFSALADDELFVLDRASGDFDLQGARSANTFNTDAVQVTKGSDRVLVPETGVDVVNVEQDTGFNQIQPAVSAANPSDTIEIKDRTYNGEVTIGKNITLTEADNNTSTPTISGQVRITGAVDSSEALEVSELDLEYDSNNAGSGKKSTILFKQNQYENVTLDSNTITAPSDGFAVYKQKSSGSSSPDDNITFENNTFKSGDSGADQLVVIEADSNNRPTFIDFESNVLTGTVNSGPALKHEGKNSIIGGSGNGNDFTGGSNSEVSRNNGSVLVKTTGDSITIEENDFPTAGSLVISAEGDDTSIKNNSFDSISTDSPIIEATGRNTSISGNTAGGDNLPAEGESEAGNDVQNVIDQSGPNETVEIEQGGSSDNKETYTIDQNQSDEPNKNTVAVNASNVIIEGESDGDELQVPDSGPGIEITGSSTGVEIKDVGIESNGSNDTGIVVDGDDGAGNCTITGNSITVNPTAAVEIKNGSTNNVIEDNSLNTAGNASGGAGVLIKNAGDGTLIALNDIDIDSEFANGVDIQSSAGAGNVTVRFNNLRGNNAGVRNNDSEDVDARSNFWNDKTGPSGGVNDPETGRTADGEGSSINNGSNDGKVRYDEFLEIPNGFILDTGSPPDGRDTDDDDLHEDFNDDSDHFPTDGYLFLRALRQGHFDRLADIDNPGGDLSTDYTTRFDFDGDGSDDISRSDVVSMVINCNRD